VSGETLYALRDVVRREAGRTILEVPALAIPPGGITAVVGPNGAGKSTLLRVLALLDRPQRGHLELRGRRVEWSSRELVPLRREVTLVEQTPYLFRGTVLENVTFGLAVRGVPRAEAEKQAAAALARVDIAGSEGQSVRGLSGGEARRVAIARALATSPRVLLLDEPFAHVDRRRIAMLEDLTRALGGEAGKSVVVSTHDTTQARALGARVIALEDGRVVLSEEMARD
jgi:tungstate transport system ATP-binding protein